MQGYRKMKPAAERSAARRQRENDAPRLNYEVPGLVSLRLAIEERSTGHVVSTPRYLRHIMVGNAPALFLVPCGDPRCDGGHDVTHEIMGALRSGNETFKGEDGCHGLAGSSPCPRVVHYEASAQYQGA